MIVTFIFDQAFHNCLWSDFGWNTVERLGKAGSVRFSHSRANLLNVVRERAV
jgi:hypothetical protein